MIQAMIFDLDSTLVQTEKLKALSYARAAVALCPQVQHILEVLDLTNAFDFVATCEDVENGKPDPEIYLLVAAERTLPVEDCLVIEDSPSGVAAALAAGMQVVAIATPSTQKKRHQSRLLPEALFVEDPGRVAAVAAKIIKQAE